MINLLFKLPEQNNSTTLKGLILEHLVSEINPLIFLNELFNDEITNIQFNFIVNNLEDYMLTKNIWIAQIISAKQLDETFADISFLDSAYSEKELFNKYL